MQLKKVIPLNSLFLRFQVLTASSFAGTFYLDYFFSFHLLNIVANNQLLKNVVKAVTQNGRLQEICHLKKIKKSLINSPKFSFASLVAHRIPLVVNFAFVLQNVWKEKGTYEWYSVILWIQAGMQIGILRGSGDTWALPTVTKSIWTFLF